MAQQYYSNGYMFLNGQILAESVNFSVTHSSGSHSVMTQSKGRAGITPGAKTTKGKITSAVPRAGLEFDYLSSIQNDEEVNMVFYRGSKKVKFVGNLMEATEDYGFDKNSEFTCDFEGGPAEESVL